MHGLLQKANAKSRKEANDLMHRIHPELDWHGLCVHHIDHNPLNNDISNLFVMSTPKHTRFHLAKNSPIKPVKKSGFLLRCGHYTSEYCNCWNPNNEFKFFIY